MCSAASRRWGSGCPPPPSLTTAPSDRTPYWSPEAGGASTSSLRRETLFSSRRPSPRQSVQSVPAKNRPLPRINTRGQLPLQPRLDEALPAVRISVPFLGVPRLLECLEGDHFRILFRKERRR